MNLLYLLQLGQKSCTNGVFQFDGICPTSLNRCICSAIIADVKNYLNISQTAAYALTRRKDFPVCRLGSIIRVPRVAFLDWVEARASLPAKA